MRRTVDPKVVRYLAVHDVPCDNCGYNLRGLTRDTCPECGWGFDFVALVRARHPVPLHAWAFSVGGWWLAMAALMGLMLARLFWLDEPATNWVMRVMIGPGRRSLLLALAGVALVWWMRTRFWPTMLRDPDVLIKAAWGLMALHAVLILINQV